MTTSPYLRRQPVQNFLLVRERDRRRVRELRLLAFAVLPAALALLGYTWVQTEIVRGGYRVRALERRLEELARTERQLRLDASRLESLERVEAAASEELGMRFPALEQMVFVEMPGLAAPPSWPAAPVRGAAPVRLLHGAAVDGTLEGRVVEAVATGAAKATEDSLPPAIEGDGGEVEP
jgi:cell division protein FtsL